MLSTEMDYSLLDYSLTASGSVWVYNASPWEGKIQIRV